MKYGDTEGFEQKNPSPYLCFKTSEHSRTFRAWWVHAKENIETARIKVGIGVRRRIKRPGKR